MYLNFARIQRRAEQLVVHLKGYGVVAKRTLAMTVSVELSLLPEAFIRLVSLEYVLQGHGFALLVIICGPNSNQCEVSGLYHRALRRPDRWVLPILGIANLAVESPATDLSVAENA